MKCTGTTSQSDNAAELARDLLEGCRNALNGTPDLLLLFFNGPLRDEVEQLSRSLREALAPGVFLGVSCEGVLGGDLEIERRPGAALLAGSLPGVTLQPFHVGAAEWREVLGDEERLQQRIGTGEDHRGHLVIGDPFTTPVDDLLTRLDETLHAPTFGGMASAGQAPGMNMLILNDRVYTDGAVGIGFGGPVRIDTVVSQGCRPIGEPMIVTRSERNLILELGRRPALEVAQEMFERLSPEERELFQAGPFLGIVIDEYRETFGRGDFLVRGLMGADPDSGAVAVGDAVRPGQTVQFHVRDAATAHEDLVALLEPQRAVEPPAGGLLFSCNGRGTRMFDEPHHDARTIRSVLPGLPLAGFFAMGELGPVGGKTFIHGHTASLVLFRPR